MDKRPNWPRWYPLVRGRWLHRNLARLAHVWFRFEGYECPFAIHHWHCVILRLRKMGYPMCPFVPLSELTKEELASFIAGREKYLEKLMRGMPRSTPASTIARSGGSSP